MKKLCDKFNFRLQLLSKMFQVFLFYSKRSFSRILTSSRGKHRKAKNKKMNYRSAGNQKYLPYLRPSDEGFQNLRAEKYPDFVHQPSSEVPKDLAQDLAWAFNKLESKGYFYRHWVVVQGKHVLTPVSRTLVGDPGMTYRYLGLRIFTLPWSFDDNRELSEVEKACSVIGRLNQHLRVTSAGILKKRDAITLEKSQNIKIAKKDDADSSVDVAERSTETINVINSGEDDRERLGRSQEVTFQTEESTSGITLPAYRERTESSGSREASPIITDNTGPGDGGGSSTKPSYKRKRKETRAKTIEEGTDFNVALINYMDPLNPELYLKPEPYYDLGPLAVSWHMDGNLVRGSTVAVYSYTCEAALESEKGRDWMVGICKLQEDETPALAASLASGDAYFMLADLNDTHRHCVIAGDQPRFASTHRVVDSGESTLDYIQARCQEALENLIYKESHGGDNGSDHIPALKSLDVDALQLSEEVHNEVEFEWLRQFWMQGSRHASERSFWVQPMEDLERSWELLELMTKLAIEASMSHDSSEDAVRIITTIVPFIEIRERKRWACINRYSAEALFSIEPDRLPLYRPTWDDSDLSRPLPFTLTKVIKRLKARLREIQEQSS